MKFKRIYIEITNACNLNCSFCSKDNREKRFMSENEFLNTIIKIKPYTNNIYLHVKGECFLHPLLDKFLTICDSNNIKVNITTNGTLLEENVKLLTHPCLYKINISLNSENNYPNYLEKIIKTVKLLSTEKVIIYRLWAQKSLTLDQKSTVFVEKIVKEYGLDEEKVDIIKKENNIKIAHNTYIDKEELFVWPTLNEKNKSNGYCYGLKTHVAILVDGTVVPCCLDSKGIINLGNIFEETMEEILNKKRTKALQEGFKNRKPSEDLCKCCNYKNRF